jgi:xanthine dehydrogenase accessory factor
MREIADQLAGWGAAGKPYAVASVVGVSGSAPREPGAALAVDERGAAVGSVSGGCVEGAVYELCRQALTTGRPVLERFGYSDEDAFAVGLTCGGVIEVFVQPVRAQDPLDAGVGRIAAGEPVALVRVITAPEALPELLGSTLTIGADDSPGTEPGPGFRPGRAADGLAAFPALRAAVLAHARAMLDAGRTGTVVLAPDGTPCGPGGAVAETGTGDAITFFVESYVPRPRMLVFGAIDFAAAVAGIGSFLGYRVTVCDARPVFATRRRFPTSDEVVVDWPHRYLDQEYRAGRLDARTVVCVLTHDAKFDVPLLERALRLPLGYVGAMGSRRTHRDRLARLRDAGLTQAELGRLHSPIGLDLGARTPEETAVAVAAEIIAHHRGGAGLPLSSSDTPIHHEPGTVPAPGTTPRMRTA